MAEDYGEPIYVEAHGGKNHVILYRSKTDPNLAVEFFFRSCSKDGRSRYYRCTKCWYLYKLNRGTCATLIVRDGRIITDPENPVVPHQCDFRPLEAVAANRAWIAGRKRRAKGVSHVESSWITADCDSINGEAKQPDGAPLELFIDNNGSGERAARSLKNAEIVSKEDWRAHKREQFRITWHLNKPTDENCEMASPSGVSQASSDSVDSTNALASRDSAAGSQASSQSSDCFVSSTSRSLEFVGLINAAFADSMQKRSGEALIKLKKAVDMKENFDIDDISLIDNVFSAEFAKAADSDRKMFVCEDWVNLLTKILPNANSRWMSHYQFSVYYCFHMIALLTRQTGNLSEKKRLFESSQKILKGFLSLMGSIHDSPEEVISTKLDILLSLSFICTQYSDVCDADAANFVENELHIVEESIGGSYAPEVSSMMLQKVMRITSNLEEFKWTKLKK